MQIQSVCFFRSQLIRIYTVCKSRVYPRSARLGLITKFSSFPLLYCDNVTVYVTLDKSNIRINIFLLLYKNKWVARRHNTYLLTCAPNEDKSACASAQFEQSLRCPHIKNFAFLPIQSYGVRCTTDINFIILYVFKAVPKPEHISLYSQ